MTNLKQPPCTSGVQPGTAHPPSVPTCASQPTDRPSSFPRGSREPSSGLGSSGGGRARFSSTPPRRIPQFGLRTPRTVPVPPGGGGVLLGRDLRDSPGRQHGGKPGTPNRARAAASRLLARFPSSGSPGVGANRQDQQPRNFQWKAPRGRARGGRAEPRRSLTILLASMTAAAAAPPQGLSCPRRRWPPTPG